jgi:alkaline phosphatase
MRSRHLCRHRSLVGASLGVLLLASLLGNTLADAAKPTGTGHAQNIIMLLGDGMGDSEITLARNYHVGANGRLALDMLPYTGEYTTYALQEANPALPDYVTDSAASGTGWSTGQKTSNGRISTTAGSDQDLTTILELAKSAGMATGDVTTAELTDATPAVLASHVAERDCQGPADMEACPQDRKAAGGPGSIAEQEVDHGVDVLLGGGKQRFDQQIDGGASAGMSVTSYAQSRGYQLVTDADGLNAVTSDQKLLGLFASGNIDLEWTGKLAAVGGTDPQMCQEGQRPANQPSLAAMTTKALELLDAKGNHGVGRKGFFLQVEGASIDKQDHAANPCGQIGETIAFDAAVQVALDFAAAHPDTLVIVTADHAHTSQIVPVGASSPGETSTLITADGAEMTVNYATSDPGESQQHTGSEVRIAAQGPQAQRVLGITNQTDVFTTFEVALGFKSADTP